MINIICVLKSGGCYNIDYVKNLYSGIYHNTNFNYNFYCLTDIPDKIPAYIKTKELKYGLEGWWSKMELYRSDLFNKNDKILFFDLDTLILNNIDELANIYNHTDFVMLRGANRKARELGDVPASGIMGWKHLSSHSQAIFDAFFDNPEDNIAQQKKSTKGAGQKGDQGFIGDLLGWDNIDKIQDYLPHKYIMFKRQVCYSSKPRTHIVAWSGTPRLHNISKTNWIGRMLNFG